MSNWLKMPRRNFLKGCAATAVSAAMPTGTLLAAAQTESKANTGVLANVNPLVGTGWRGHMFPGAVAPFGMMQLSPDTAGGPEPSWNAQGDWYGWNHCSGYHYHDNIVLGFTHTHLQGTGGGDLGDILLMPVVAGRNWSWDPGAPPPLAEMQIENAGPDSGWVFDKPVPGYRSFFSHEREEARPGYYRVHLDTPDVEAELTATTRCGMHRYRFPKTEAYAQQGVLLDLAHGIGAHVYHAELNIESSTRITGKRYTQGWAQNKQIYFVIEFSQPFGVIQTNLDGKESTAAVGDNLTGVEIKAIFAHAPSAEPLVIRTGISPTSVEGAAKNLSTEVPHCDFDAVLRETQAAWLKAIGVLDADLSTSKLRETFYTDAYRGLVAPATFNDVDGTYRGQDRKNHANPGFTKYTELSIWDIYRGEFPFIMLTQPHRTNDIVRTLIADYDQLGLHTLPMWPLWGNETWSMTGFHAAGMILGAYVRGFRGFDAEAAYAAIRDTAIGPRDSAPAGSTQRDLTRSRSNGQLQDVFRRYGYVPTDSFGGSVSCTLDLSYDYWCAGAMAQLLGKHDDAAMFFKLAQNYRNVYDASTGFMRGKTKDGQWRTPFQPNREISEDYVETDAWQASFAVPHDVAGLIQLHGGDAAFIEKLNGLFTAPSLVLDARPDITGMVGQDAQGNEPSNHNPYLFSFAGAPWLTQKWVRKVAGLYNNTPAGIPGNDDCGQLASWFVFASLGFYPVNAASGVYVIGSPLVNRVTIRNPQGKPFTIVAENNSPQNLYIQSARLNGRELTRSWLTHAEIVAGGDLHFRMSATPNRDWATAPADRPPSGLIPGTS